LRRLVVTGENDHVFVAEIHGQSIALQDTGVIAPGGFSRRDDGALVLALRNNRCATPGRLPPTRWRLARAQRCSEGERTSHVEGVPVDGAIVSGVRGDAQRCRVRSAVTLPVRGTVNESTGAGITVLTDATNGGWEGNQITLDLLVRGRRLDVAFTPTLGADGVTARRGFGVALPPGAVEAHEETVQGVTFWRVRVRAPVPLRPGPTCLAGRWVLRASYDNTEGDQAFANRYHEFGACE
jgi:hypothetical protein